MGERPARLMGRRAEHRRAHPPPNPPSFPQLINLEVQMGSQRGSTGETEGIDSSKSRSTGRRRTGHQALISKSVSSLSQLLKSSCGLGVVPSPDHFVSCTLRTISPPQGPFDRGDMGLAWLHGPHSVPEPATLSCSRKRATASHC